MISHPSSDTTSTDSHSDDRANLAVVEHKEIEIVVNGANRKLKSVVGRVSEERVDSCKKESGRAKNAQAFVDKVVRHQEGSGGDETGDQSKEDCVLLQFGFNVQRSADCEKNSKSNLSRLLGDV